MTSDAKIGLLLGLVLIFIIAFIINGLPSFQGGTDSNELTATMLNSSDNPPGLAARERQINRELVHPQHQQASARFEPRPVDRKPEIRYQMPLSESASVTTRQTEEINVASQITANDQLVARQPNLSFPQNYEIKSGETLASIAKKFYGPELGNKRATIDKIYQANKNVLASPDRVVVGQKIVIPDIGSDTENTSRAGLIANSLFESVRSIGQRKEEQPKQRTYTIRTGDSLWKIAQDQLGDGSRYKEIAKLNKSEVDNINRLTAGMKIKLPAN